MRLAQLLHLFGSRGVPSFLFGLMAVLALDAALHATGAGDLLFHLLSGVLWAMLVVLVNVRPAPLRRGRSVSGVLAALGAQGAIILVGAVSSGSDAGARLWIGDAMLAWGLCFSIVSVAVLGRCFGVLPDVRGLVTRGPYRLVRHPLYLGELTAALGLVVGAKAPAAAGAAWIACVVFQLLRTRYEEAGLLEQFPEYAEYAHRTPRLIPGLV